MKRAARDEVDHITAISVSLYSVTECCTTFAEMHNATQYAEGFCSVARAPVNDIHHMRFTSHKHTFTHAQTACPYRHEHNHYDTERKVTTARRTMYDQCTQYAARTSSHHVTCHVAQPKYLHTATSGPAAPPPVGIILVIVPTLRCARALISRSIS